MPAATDNRQRILMALSGQNAADDLPFLPWGLDALADPPDPSYAPLFDLLRRRAVIKRRWLSRPDLFTPAAPVACHTQSAILPDGTVEEIVHLCGASGELTCRRRSIPGTSAHEATSRFLKSPEDVELYLSWPFAGAMVDASPYFDLEDSVNRRGVVTLRVSTALGIVGESFEPEPFAICSVENYELVQALLRNIAGRVTDYVRQVLHAGARPIFILSGPEFATPPLLSPRHFDDFVRRYDQTLIDLIHGFGCRIIVHCHGRLNAVLERFVAMGVDGLHPLEGPPMGDVTLAQAKARVGDRLCILGTLQIGDMMAAEPDEIRRQVRAIRRDAPGGMILTTSATPYETLMTSRLMENYAAAIDAAST
jgi:hypothetical protein